MRRAKKFMAQKSRPGKRKSSFVTELLGRKADASQRAINKAWTDGGNEGTISASLVQKVRSRLERTHGEPTRRDSEAPAAPKHERSGSDGAASQSAEPVSPQVHQKNGPVLQPAMGAGAAVANVRERVLDELEADFDRLLFRLMDLGGMTEVEDALRRARRLLILSGLPH
jgi:hypothetical protein